MGFLNKIMRGRTLLLTAVLMIVAAQSLRAQTWNCGVGADSTKVTATLSGGTLTVSGTGAMRDLSSTNPWWNVRSSITNVVIGDSVTSIGSVAFHGCTNMVSVTIGSRVTIINGQAFEGCTGLTSVTIPNSVTSIRPHAFVDCRGLKSITFSDSVGIEEYAFLSCSGIDSITINKGSVGRDAFLNCTGLRSVTINGGSVESQAFQVLNQSSTKLTSVTINGGSVGSGAFSGHTNITSVTINGGSVGSGAFQGGTGPTSVTINGGSVGSGAFQGSARLTSVTFGGGSIEWSAFAGCSALRSFTIDGNVSFRNLNDGDWRPITSLTIGNGANSAGDLGLNSIRYPKLTTIEVASGNANYYSEDNILFNKDKTTIIIYPKNKEGAYNIPNGVTTIEASAFNGCKNLTSIIIPNSVTRIGASAFYGCDSLTSVTIGNSLTSINGFNFNSYPKLTTIDVMPYNTAYSSVDGILFNKSQTTLIKYPQSKQGASYAIPNSVDTITGSAFSNSTALTSVTIPNSVKSIGSSAFSGCTALTTIVNLNTVPHQINAATFNGVDKSSACLNVPVNAIAAYLSADYWKDFTCINVAQFAVVSFDSRDGSAVSSQNIALAPGSKASRPADPVRSGYIVSGWYKDAAYTSEWNFDADVVTGDMTLYAKWVKGYIITWNADGGYPVPTQVSVVDGGVISAPAAMSRAERAFLDWYGDAGYSSPVSFPVSGVSSDRVFYAKWGNIGVTGVSGVPLGVKAGTQFALVGAVVPADATNRSIVWSVEDAGVTGAGIYNGNVFLALERGTAVIKATVAGGKADGTDYVQLFSVSVGDEVISVLSGGREVPLAGAGVVGAVAPVPASGVGFAAGPNPAGPGGAVSFFLRGALIRGATLYVYDASGNLVRRVTSGVWDLRDAGGHRVSAGAYLVRGAVSARGGKKERVSAVVGVR